MTERTRGSQVTGSNQEVIDLNELHASKVTDAIRSEMTRPENTDLASASIQSISVVRLSSRPEKRKVIAPPLTTSEETSPSKESRQATASRPRRDEKFGILKNPFYKYEGNVLERCITLLANLLKALEFALLRTFKSQPPPTPSKINVVKPKRRGPDGREIDEEARPTTGENIESQSQREPDGIKHHRE